jgi:hypothetical protein
LSQHPDLTFLYIKLCFVTFLFRDRFLSQSLALVKRSVVPLWSRWKKILKARQMKQGGLGVPADDAAHTDVSASCKFIEADGSFVCG